jgi:peroxiredoxin
MALTNRYYGGTSLGAGRTIQDFGLCDLNGTFVYTAKSRTKGFLVIGFFDPAGRASTNAVKSLQQWTEELGADKLVALAVAGPNRQTLSSFAQAQSIEGITVLVDHDLHQTRNWGISHLPSTFVIDGKTGRILTKVIGDDPQELTAAKNLLAGEIAKVKAAEEAAKKAEEEKKAAEAAAKAAEAAKAEAEKKPETAKA